MEVVRHRVQREVERLQRARREASLGRTSRSGIWEVSGNAPGLALGPTAASRGEGEPSTPSAEHMGPLGMGLARLGGLFPSNIWPRLQDW